MVRDLYRYRRSPAFGPNSLFSRSSFGFAVVGFPGLRGGAARFGRFNSTGAGGLVLRAFGRARRLDPLASSCSLRSEQSRYAVANRPALAARPPRTARSSKGAADWRVEALRRNTGMGDRGGCARQGTAAGAAIPGAVGNLRAADRSRADAGSDFAAVRGVRPPLRGGRFGFAGGFGAGCGGGDRQCAALPGSSGGQPD